MQKISIPKRLLSLVLALVLVLGMVPWQIPEAKAVDYTTTATVNGLTYSITLTDVTIFTGNYDTYIMSDVTDVDVASITRDGNTVVIRVRVYFTAKNGDTWDVTKYFTISDSDCTKVFDTTRYHDDYTYMQSTYFKCRIYREATSHVGGTTCASTCTRCNMTYAAVDHSRRYALQSGSTNVLVESCANCSHSATATLSATDATFNGSSQKTGTITYSDNWLGSRPTTISYADNVYAGTATASIAVKGIPLTTTFQVKPYSIMGPASVTISPSSGVYTGQLHRPTITVSSPYFYYGGDKGFSVTWSPSDPVNAGTYMGTVLMTGDYAGNFSVQYTITPASLTDISVQVIAPSAACGVPTVSTTATAVGNQPVSFAYSLTEGRSYGKMPVFSAPGTYTVYYKASAPNHNDATGSFSVTIQPHKSLRYALEGTNVLVESCDTCGHRATATLNTFDRSYTGSPITNATITYTDNWYGSRPGADQIVYANNLTVGTATATLSVQGYTLTKNFTISDAYAYGGGSGALNPSSGVYTGNVHTPAFTFTWQGKVLTEGTDYSVSWQSGPPVNVGEYKLVFNPINNFTGGTSYYTYTVKPADITGISITQTGSNDLTAIVTETATTVNNQKATFTYSLTEGGPYGPMPAVADNGTHTIYYKVSAPNHNDALGSIQVSLNHACYGGTATCTNPATCAVCGKPYGETDLTNHEPDTDYTNGFCNYCDSCQSAVKNQQGVYEISNAGQLFWFAQQMDSNAIPQTAGAVLTTDIDLENRLWTPIGTYNESVIPEVNHAYKGTFDGQGHVIKNLNVHVTDGRNAGLFGRVDGGTLKNFGVVNAAVVSDPVEGKLLRAGIVAGEIVKGTVKNVFTAGTLSVTSESAQKGGIAAMCADSTLSGCFTTFATLTDNTGAVPATVQNCYYLADTPNSASCGTNLTAAQFAGGEAAYLLNGKKNAGIWKQTLGTDALPGFEGEDVYYGYLYCAQETPGYTNDSSAVSEAFGHVFDEDGFCAKGCYQSAEAVEGVYQITNIGQLYWFAQTVNGGEKTANAILLSDLDLQGREWTTICSTDLYYNTSYYGDTGYEGTFNGNGHVIRNFVVKGIAGTKCSVGLFGTTYSATIKNLGVDEMTFDVNGAADVRAAAIVGQMIYTTVENCYVINSTLTPGQFIVGGIAACNYAGVICNSFTKNVAISGHERCGNLVSDTRGDRSDTDRRSTVKNCYTDADRIFGTQSSGSNYLYDNMASVTDEQFASGEIAYLLGDAWGQTLGTDPLPNLTSPRVYLSKICEREFYSNEYQNVAHNYENGFCTVSGCIQSAPVNNNGTAEDTSDDYYEISNAGQLYWLAQQIPQMTGSFRAELTADITFPGDIPWTPISAPENVSTDAVFDGNGHTIEIGSQSGGLFATFNYGTIENLTLRGSITAGGGNVGALVGSAYRTQLRNIISYADVTNESGNAGGLVGYYGGKHADGRYSRIENCAVYANITGSNAGGLVGEGWNGTQYYDISDCAYVGNVTGTNAGAIVGYQNTDSNTCTFTNIYWCETDGLGFYGKRDTENQVYTNTEAMTAEAFAAGEVAYLLQGEQTEPVWGQTIGTDSYPLLGGAKVYKNQSSGCSDPNVTYSYANAQQEEAAIHNVVKCYCADCGAHFHLEEAGYPDNGFCVNCNQAEPAQQVDGVYRIGNAGNLFWFARLVNGGEKDANAILTASIDLSGRAWSPICSTALYYETTEYADTGYTGTFDGAGYEIFNLTITGSSTEDASFGLFGTLSGTVKNLGIRNYTYTGAGKDSRVGAVAGQMLAGALVENSNVIHANINTKVNTDNGVAGGIAGCNYAGTVRNCFAGDITISAGRSGGIVGDNRADGGTTDRPGTITNCYTNYSTLYDARMAGVEATGEAGISAARLASGEITWRLNGADSGLWKQTVGTDDLPGFTGDTVYRNRISGCGEPNGVYEYGNTKLEDVTTHTFIQEGNGFCIGCGTYEAPVQNESGVYEIRNAGQLYWFASKANNKETGICGMLMADIVVNPGTIGTDASYTSVNGESLRSWEPIGRSYYEYKGTFDGNGHTISGLYYHNQDRDYVGLFGRTAEGAVIRNLGLVNSFFAGDYYVGGLVGVHDGLLENCYYSGGILGDSDVGGLVGLNYNVVRYCYTTAVVKSTDDYVGAVAGSSSGLLANCYYISGNAKDGSGTVQYGVGCYSTGNTLRDVEGCTQAVTAEYMASGQVAYLLNDCKNTGIWKQTIGTNAAPNFDGATVYGIWTDCASWSCTNDSALATQQPSHSFDNGLCTLCDAYESAVLNESGVYEISNAGQLYWFAQQVNLGNNSICGKLTADITINPGIFATDSIGYTPAAGETSRMWMPMAGSNVPYNGTFDGNGKTISGLYIRTTNAYSGLFGGVGKTGVVKNVTIVNACILGDDYLGCVAGINKGTVENCSFDGYIEGNDRIGGVAGENYGTVKTCMVSGMVSGYNRVGGVVGRNEGTTEYCGSTAKISGFGSFVGGVVGYLYSGKVSHSYATGTITGMNYTGGVTGYSTGVVEDCCYLTGIAQTGIGNTVTDTQKITCSMSQEAFASGQVTYLLNGGKTDETALWKQPIGTDALPGFNGQTVYCTWSNCREGTYSNDSTLATTQPAHSFANGFCILCDTYESASQNENGFYEIHNAGQFYWFALQFDLGGEEICGELMADIVINPGTFAADGSYTPAAEEALRLWQPIGGYGKMYKGTLNGNGHSISGMYVNMGSQQEVGLIGYLHYDGKVERLGLINSYVSGGDHTGGVVGYADGDVIGCYNQGFVTGKYRTGGVVGNARSVVSECYNTGTVNGLDYVGGVVGYASSCDIVDCYNTGTVSGTRRVGGVVGYLSSRSIVSCYSTGMVSGDDDVGGIVGYRSSADVENCYYNNEIYTGEMFGYDYYKGNSHTGGAMTTAQFASGEVAYLLQSGVAPLVDGTVPRVWGQNIDNGKTAQPSPVFSDATVYKVTTCSGETFIAYSNTDSTEPHVLENCICTVCGTRAHEETAGYDDEGFCPNGCYEPAKRGSDGVYEIETAGQLYWFSEYVDSNIQIAGAHTKHDSRDDVFTYHASARLVADIVVNRNLMSKLTVASDGTATVKEGETLRQWNPIGDHCMYGGRFDGNYHTVSGLYCNDAETRYAGLFGYVGDDSEIRNVGVTDSYLYGESYAGGLASDTYNATIENCFSTAVVCVGGYDVGGLVGYSYNSTIENCYSIATVIPTKPEKTRVGGLIGYSHRDVIENCYFSTDVYTGEAIGSSSNSTITNVMGKTDAQFASGEVAYLLQSGITDSQVWGQNIDNGKGVQTVPVFSDATVYMPAEGQYSNSPFLRPTLTGESFNLVFEDEVRVGFYYTVSDETQVVEQGLLAFYTNPGEASIAQADAVYSGSLSDGTKFMGVTSGIPAKEMGDERYYCAYAKLSDGTYVYSNLYPYSPKQYAINMLGRDTTSDELKVLCVAMLNYGAAAQQYFGYKTDCLMNADLTAAQQALVQAYDPSLFRGPEAVDTSKVGAFASTGSGFTSRTASVSFDGAFAINYYFTPSAKVSGDMTLYIWDAATYAAAEVLTADNATAVTMVESGNGSWWEQVAGIAAKNIDSTYYVAGVYTDEYGNTHCTGVIAYSLSKYCMNNAKEGKPMQALASATAMYGYYAKAYFTKK